MVLLCSLVDKLCYCEAADIYTDTIYLQYDDIVPNISSYLTSSCCTHMKFFKTVTLLFVSNSNTFVLRSEGGMPLT